MQELEDLFGGYPARGDRPMEDKIHSRMMELLRTRGDRPYHREVRGGVGPPHTRIDLNKRISQRQFYGYPHTGIDR